MLKTITTALFTTSLLTLPIAVSAHSDHCQDTQLGEKMKSLKHRFKSYRQALADENWEQMAAARQKMLKLTSDAANEQPLKLHDMTPEHHPAMMQEYRKGLQTLDQLFNQLAEAEQVRNADQATELVGRIGQHSKQSHESLRKDCD